VEAVVVAGLMSIGLLGLSGSTILLTRAAKVADSTSAATSLATKQLELLRSMPMDAPSHRPGTYTAGTYYPNGGTGGPITVRWVVSSVDTPRAGLKTITVTSSWNEANRAHSTVVAGYVRCSRLPC
jgi:Tfp pilus assembly protein PilV